MDQGIYWIFSMAVGIIALVISACSLLLSIINRNDNKKALLLAKKTSVLEKVHERRAKLGHLAMIYAQQLLCYVENPKMIENDPQQHERIRRNLEVVKEHIKGCDDFTQNIAAIRPSDLEPWEDMLATSTGFLTHVREELEKEKSILTELQKQVAVGR